MNADIITDTTYPHGTIEGFQGGCNTAHCPAEVSCRTVHTRYVGDWAFRRQINAGMTPTEIVAAEQKQAQEAADADLRAKKAKGSQRSAETRDAARERHNAARRAKRAANLIPQKALIPRDKLAALLGEGLTDRQIADRINQTRVRKIDRRTIWGVRKRLGLNPNPAPATTGASS